MEEVALPSKPQRDRVMPNTLPVGSTYVHPSSGYAEIKLPPGQGRRRGGWQWEHKVVMEGLLGRKLAPGEEVHHKNRIRHDNRPENLELWLGSQPPGARVQDLIDWLVIFHKKAVVEALEKTAG